MRNLIYPGRWFRHLISMPIILSVIAPVVFMDLWIEIYHRTCFPLFGIPYVSRRKYIKVDRYKLSYLSGWQKIGCAYCGYVNGAFAYFLEIAAQSETYWCGVKHKKDRANFQEPEHHKDFLEYNDFNEYNDKFLSERYKK